MTGCANCRREESEALETDNGETVYWLAVEKGTFDPVVELDEDKEEAFKWYTQPEFPSEQVEYDFLCTACADAILDGGTL